MTNMNDTTSEITQQALMLEFEGILGFVQTAFRQGRTAHDVAYAAYGLATAGWMMYAIIAANLLAFAVGPALNAIVSKAAPANEQGLAMGALSSLASLVAVIAPLAGTPLLAEVSHMPANDWKMGAPFFLSSLLAFAALALALAHFSRHRVPATAN